MTDEVTQTDDQNLNGIASSNTCLACGQTLPGSVPTPPAPTTDPVQDVEQTVQDGEKEITGAEKLLADLHQLESDLAPHGAGLVGILKSLIKDKLGITL